MKQCDVVIIGAGLLGCFTARNLRRYNIDVTVLEREADVCRGISKANTGIIYSGYDTKPGSLKSKLCVQANEDFDKLCTELDVRFERPGSLMLAYGPQAEKVLRNKYRDGIEGGVKGMSLISGDKALELEPALAPGVTLGLLCESTGTVNPWELCIAAYENARDNGAKFEFRSPVVNLRRCENAFVVETAKESYAAKAVVNAAGLCSDTIRELVEKPMLRIKPRAADYIVLDRRGEALGGREIKRIIQHEAEDGKGLTIVPTVDGSVLVGPTNRATGTEDKDAADFRVSECGIDELKKLCAEIIPSLKLDRQLRSFGSLRPNTYLADDEKKYLHDFTIQDENGLYSLIGIKTPGLTFSNELGRKVAESVAAYLGQDKEVQRNETFNPCRKDIVRANSLSTEERAALIKEDSNFGEIVCECMDVTKAEVLEAVRRGATDYEGVRRRTGVGMGHCQGSRCRKKIIDIIGGQEYEEKY